MTNNAATQTQNKNKPFVVRFHSDPYLLSAMYMCYSFKISYDTLFVTYEKFGKDCLLFYDMLASKGYIKWTRKQFAELIESCTKLDKQIKKHEIVKSSFDEKMQDFIKFLEKNCEDLYSYTIKFFFDMGDLYGKKGR